MTRPNMVPVPIPTCRDSRHSSRVVWPFTLVQLNALRLTGVLLVALFMFAGCASEPAASASLTQREKEILQIAITFAQKSGCHLSDYQAPRLQHDPRFGDWWVIFREKPPGHAGGDIIVSVDDSTGVANFIPTR